MKDTLHRLRELEAAATPGPWQAVEYGVHTERKAIAGRGFGPVDDFYQGVYCDQPDADLIAEMRNALPALLDRLEKLEAVVETVKHLRINRSMSIDIPDWDTQTDVDGIGFTFSDWEKVDDALAALEDK